jgi:hypothetical protein
LTAPDEDHAAFLERVRNSGIRIDREGQLWHQGHTIDHAGLRAALFRWLDRNPDGRYVFRLDAQRFANVEVADTPLVVRSLRWEGEGAIAALSDGSEERLDPSTLTIDPAGVLRCQARGGRLAARLSTSAAAVLAERIEGDRLRIDGQRVAIPPLRGETG